MVFFGHSFRRLALAVPGVVALTCALALPLAAQVTPAPVVDPRRELPPRLPLSPARAPGGDLVIKGVTLNQYQYRIRALVTIANAGSAPVLIPQGTMLARGDRVQGGSAAFSPVTITATGGWQLSPGATVNLGLDATTDWCPAGHPGDVRFRVDPESRVAEASRSNNEFTLPTSSSRGDIQSAQVWLESQYFPPSQGGFIELPYRNLLWPGRVADLVVYFQNTGPGFVLVCPGVPLLAEVQSPMPAAIGLRTFSSPTNLVSGAMGFIAAPGGWVSIKIRDAVPGVLPAGTYSWQFLLNPQGTVAESNRANNSATTAVTVPAPASP